MRITKALGTTSRMYKSRFFQGAVCVLVQLVLRLIVAAPLLSLVTTEIRWLALLSIPLYMIIIPPARQNMACAMQCALSGGPLVSGQLLFGGDYKQKFRRGLKHGLLMLLWALPFIVATGVLVWAYKGHVDAVTLLKTLPQLGGGSMEQGVKNVLMIYAATLLPIVLGCALHSGTRHAIALDDRKLLRGHRLGVIVVWFIGLIALIPFFAAVYFIMADFANSLVNALKSLSFDSLSLPSLNNMLYALGAAFVVLFLPLLPFKQLLTAAYVRELKQ